MVKARRDAVDRQDRLIVERVQERVPERRDEEALDQLRGQLARRCRARAGSSSLCVTGNGHSPNGSARLGAVKRHRRPPSVRRDGARTGSTRHRRPRPTPSSRRADARGVHCRPNAGQSEGFFAARAGSRPLMQIAGSRGGDVLDRRRAARRRARGTRRAAGSPELRDRADAAPLAVADLEDLG